MLEAEKSDRMDYKDYKKAAKTNQEKKLPIDDINSRLLNIYIIFSSIKGTVKYLFYKLYQ